MKTKNRLLLKLVIVAFFCIFPLFDSDAVLLGRHTIESFYFTTSEAFAFLDDGSVWLTNPTSREVLFEQAESLTGRPITLMPESGTEEYPIRIIIERGAYEDWIDFTAELESAPTQPDRIVIGSLDLEAIPFPILTAPDLFTEDALPLLLFISPTSIETVANWSAGQRIVAGGIWFPEYDPVGHQDYVSAFPYVLYNYDMKNCAFFTY